MRQKQVLKEAPYRPGVGIMLLNAQKKVFVGQRIDETRPAWQMPQGGIDAGETPLAAACRELAEEIGTRAFEVRAESSTWHSYDFPPEVRSPFCQYRGQRQKWFLFQFTGEDKDIFLETKHPEFSHWKWVYKEDLVPLIVPFKRDLYKAVIDDLWPTCKNSGDVGLSELKPQGM